MKHSSEIEVAEFRQILIWPLLLFEVDNNGVKQPREQQNVWEKVTKRLVDDGKGPWTWRDKGQDVVQLKDQVGCDGSKIYQDEQDFSEIVYFHSFVRDFLYGGDGKSAKQRPLRVFTRDDVKECDVTLVSGETYSHSVVRIEFYLVESGVAVLVVELATPNRQDKQPIKLSEALELQNVLRMAFPRRWNDKGKPSESPLRVEFKAGSATRMQQDYRTKDDFVPVVRHRAELPAAKHWKYLLEPLGLYGDAKSGYCFQQIEDQRIPSMAYFAVDKPREISSWDFARIAFLDGSGDSLAGSYSDDFLKEWEKKHTYDRFWQQNPSSGEGGKLDEKRMRTRWLCSGYGMAVVGAADDPFFTGQIAANFRHHYFRMGLIAHFHRASLLMLRDALADATKHDEETKLKLITDVQERMVEFRSRYWFREVSTQLQGQEFFHWWSDHLGNRDLFQQVSSDIDAAAAFVRTKQENAEKEYAKQLNQIAAIAASFSLAMTFVGLIATYVGLSFLKVGDASAPWDGWVFFDTIWKSVLIIASLLLVIGCSGWFIINKRGSILTKFPSLNKSSKRGEN